MSMPATLLISFSSRSTGSKFLKIIKPKFLMEIWLEAGTAVWAPPILLKKLVWPGLYDVTYDVEIRV